MGLGYHGRGTQNDMDTVGLGHRGTGTPWDWDTMELAHNRTGTQWGGTQWADRPHFQPLVITVRGGDRTGIF